jgi:hypothetical protein
MATTTLRAALAELFPAANDTDNDNLNDVIGNKTDTASTTVAATTSLVAYIKGILNDLEILSDHIHGVSKVYPTLAAGVTVTASATPWTLGSFVEIVPASTITSIYDIHAIKVEAFDTTTTYELVLYQGASDVEVGRARITRNTAQATSPYVIFMTPRIAANARIRAKVASAASSAATVTISIMYHTY